MTRASWTLPLPRGPRDPETTYLPCAPTASSCASARCRRGRTPRQPRPSPSARSSSSPRCACSWGPAACLGARTVRPGPRGQGCPHPRPHPGSSCSQQEPVTLERSAQPPASYSGQSQVARSAPRRAAQEQARPGLGERAHVPGAGPPRRPHVQRYFPCMGATTPVPSPSGWLSFRGKLYPLKTHNKAPNPRTPERGSIKTQLFQNVIKTRSPGFPQLMILNPYKTTDTQGR